MRRNYANVTATLALILALTGTAYAATKIRSKDIVNGQVKSADIGKNAVTSKKVKNGSLTASDFKASSLPAGPAGPAGANGTNGQQGPTGPKGADASLPDGLSTLVPIAAFTYSGGNVTTEAHRAPVTGAPQVAQNSTSYFVSFPGASIKVIDDAIQCTPLANTGDVHLTINSGGNALEVRLYNSAGTQVSGSFTCSLTNIKDS